MTKMMKTLKKNKSKTAEPITSEVIEANIDMAQRDFKNSKTSASEAAAYAYFVWRDTLSPHADTYAADWIKTEIEKRNDEISRHNKVENDDRERAEKFALGRLKQAAISKNEQVRLRGLAALDDEAWKLRLKVPIEAREDANAFSKIVKFVFRFDSPADASNTSRYAKVLEWIDAHCATVQGPSEIVSAIKDAGGFDKVIHMQRLVRNGPKAPDTDEKSDNLNILSSTFSKALSEARLQATAKGGAGQVETGWGFDLSDPIRPKYQYCSYRQNVSKGKVIKYTIAINGTPRPPSPLAKLVFNFDGALSNCIWFSGA